MSSQPIDYSTLIRLIAAAVVVLSPTVGADASSEAPSVVQVWLTEVDQGDRKDALLGASSEDGRHFDIHQDRGYRLLSKESFPLAHRAPESARWRIQIDPLEQRHGVLGVGAAMTDSAAYVLSHLKQHNPPLYAFTMRKLFSPKEGAGFSYLRRPIGSSDYTATSEYYTYADERSDTLSTFSIAHDTEYIIPVLKEALRINPQLKIMGTPWSPPAWMKTNERLIGVSESQKAAGKVSRLKPEYFSLYADYLVRVCRAYAEQGVKIHALTLQNEPQFDAAKYPCLRMTVGDQIRLLKELGPAMHAAGLRTEIYVHDHNWVLHENDLRVVAGDVKQQPVDVVTQILSDPDVAQYVAGSAWHCYSGNAGDMRRVYRQVRSRFPDKQILCTEATGWGRSRGSWWGDVHWGLQHNWLDGLAAGSSVALQWNLALDHQFGPTLREDSAAMGLVTINTDTWQDARFEREFYAMAQVSLAAQPGSRVLKHKIVAATSAAVDVPLRVLALRQADGTFAAVVVNQTNDPVSLSIECGERAFGYRLSGHAIATFCWSRP